jgi:predicted unusual protein kinase regulating ubiquinone biosynthesis (AarF/ABC1/UbiB family)
MMFVVSFKCLGLFIKFKLQYIDKNTMIKTMLQEFSEINILHVKALQWNIQGILNSNPEITKYFEHLSDNVPYTENDINHDILDRIENYTKTTNQTFSIDNNYKPFKSGTIALVFKGLLNDKPIVIKMLRKGVNTEIECGINNIIITSNIICFFMSFFYSVNNTIFIKNIKANRKILIEQTDFKKEIQNNEVFQKISKLHQNIVIPHIYKEFSDISSEIIIMDFLESKPLDSVNTMETYKKTFINFAFDGIFVHNILHADMHQGNILFLNDKKVGIIDFGMIISNISNKHCNNVIDILFALKNNDMKRLIAVLCHIVCNDSDKRIKIREKITNILKTFTNDNNLCLNSSEELINFFKKVFLEIGEVPDDIANMMLGFISMLNIILNKFYTNKPFPEICKELINNIV